MSNELIKSLKELISQPRKGSTGYTVLVNSERVTAYKITAIIIKLEKQEE